MRHAGCETSDARQLFRANQLALRVEQPVRHPIQAFGQGREIPRVGIRRAGGEVTVGDGVGSVHHARQRAKYQASHE